MIIKDKKLKTGIYLTAVLHEDIHQESDDFDVIFVKTYLYGLRTKFKTERAYKAYIPPLFSTQGPQRRIHAEHAAPHDRILALYSSHECILT